jgi:hypothetical protein
MPVTVKGKLPNLDFSVSLTAGIHASEGSEAHKGGLTNADVGSFHEFGFGVPQRSWLRAYFDENEARLGALVEDAIISAVIDGADLEQQLGLVAVQIEGEIKERILAGIGPQLADATKRKRGASAVPLLDSGQLLGAIRAQLTVIANS